MAKVKKKNKKKNEIFNIKRQINKLENQEIELKNKLRNNKKELKRQCHIRNLRLSKDIVNLTLPFVICTGISIGSFSLSGFGFPLKRDNITKYKRYDFNYCTNDEVELENYYERHTFYDADLPTSKLSIYYPWEDNNGTYTRTKRVYDLDDNNYNELLAAIVNKDIDFINQFKESNYKEEKQTCNKKLYNDDDNVMYIDAELHYYDKNDILQVKEGFYRNFLVTLISLGLGLGIGAIVANNRKFSFRDNIKDNELYHFDDIKNCKININVINDSLIDVNKKIEELNKKLVKSNGTK